MNDASGINFEVRKDTLIMSTIVGGRTIGEIVFTPDGLGELILQLTKAREMMLKAKSDGQEELRL